MVRTVGDQPEAEDQLSKIALPETSVVESKHFGHQIQAADDEALNFQRLSFLETALHRKEQALEQTRQELDQSEQELALIGEGPPNIHGETREDLVMQLQLSMLEHVREIADLRQALRICRMSLYKSCFSTEGDTHAIAQFDKDVRSKSTGTASERSHRGPKGTVLATAQRASIRELATDPSRKWS
mmetsp:Transcript_37797/g.66596  ORF Transcript_37797/g.66596 Transcript_37797/m.66596 type:complete len:186 (-) Transcript_37797:110-667(-)